MAETTQPRFTLRRLVAGTLRERWVQERGWRVWLSPHCLWVGIHWQHRNLFDQCKIFELFICPLPFVTLKYTSVRERKLYLER